MKQVTGGVCAAQGFSAAGIHCGIRKNQAKRDLALIYSAVPASAAAVYTTNLVKGAPLTVTKAHLADGKAQAIDLQQRQRQHLQRRRHRRRRGDERAHGSGSCTSRRRTSSSRPRA
ncbi:MAG: bifunctional ornithine acetyltransferase/N-acetylglutamate synthase [Oscillospiraceae bacterium]